MVPRKSVGISNGYVPHLVPPVAQSCLTQARALSEPLVKDLKTSTARAMYNHNETRNVWFYMYAGAKGHDLLWHLAGGQMMRAVYPLDRWCCGIVWNLALQSSVGFCNDLTMGTASNEGGSVRWAYHSVVFRDDSESYNHYANGNWQGIISVVQAAMVNYAL